MYKIGEFAKIVNSSIQTLRYYDQLNILKPSETDKYTNYRYYSDKNIMEYKVIILLKKLSFSLDEINKHKNNLTEEMLLKKKQQIFNNINSLKESIKMIDNIREQMIEGKIINIVLENIEEEKNEKK